MSSVIHLCDGGKIVKTNCFECHAKCGVLCTVNAEGQLVSVQGNPDDPRNEGRMCGKGLSATRILYDPERLRYPLRRVGERGSGQWEQITWDEALEWLAEQIRSIENEYGAEAVAYGQGTGRGTNQWTSRSGNAGGKVHHSLAPGNICLGPMMVQCNLQFGMLPIYDGPDFDRADCIVFWGCNSVWTEATYTSGQIGRSRDRGAKLIVIDPLFEHPLAHKADYFLGVRPGSDTYLAYSWLNVIIEEGLYDKYFVEHFTNAAMLIFADNEHPVTESLVREGGNKKVNLMVDLETGELIDLRNRNKVGDINYCGDIKLADGSIAKVKTVWGGLRARAEEWPPEKAEEMCWVPAGNVRESARAYATAPAAAINVFQGIEEQTNCRDSMQLINIIIAICGNLEKDGGNKSMPFWNQMYGLSGPTPKSQRELMIVDERASGSLIGNSNPSAVFRAMRTGDPYPVRGYVIVAGNPLSWSENTALVKESLMSLDLLCVMDYYMSPTCELADLVLPSAHWTERDYIADEVCCEWIFAQQKTVEPLYERKSDVWFWRELGRRIHPDWWPWKTDEELFDWQLEQLNAGVTWSELKEQWIHKMPLPPSRDYETNGFLTRSGKVELYAPILAIKSGDGFPEASEPKESIYSTPEIAEKYPLTAITGRRYPIYYHSAYRGIPHLREIVPDPQVIFHTSIAQKLGIKYGEWVWIDSPTGRITMRARPSDGIDPRVCSIPHGWWQGCKKLGLDGYPDGISNANTLTSDRAYNDEFITPGLRSTLCRIVKRSDGDGGRDRK